MSIEWKKKEWRGYVRAHSDGYQMRGSKEWQNNFPKMNNKIPRKELDFDQYFRDELKPFDRFEIRAIIQKLGDKYIVSTNAFIPRVDGPTSNYRRLERNDSDYIAFFLDEDEIKRLVVSEDKEALDKYSDNFWNQMNYEKPIYIPLSDEKRKTKDIDVEFSKILFELCSAVREINELLYKLKIPIKDENNKLFNGILLQITSNNKDLSVEEQLELACIFSGTQYDFSIGHNGNNGHRLYCSNNSKTVRVKSTYYCPSRNPIFIIN